MHEVEELREAILKAHASTDSALKLAYKMKNEEQKICNALQEGMGEIKYTVRDLKRALKLIEGCEI